ncbi:MAG: 30S ribosomal protein S3ae [Candidatus Thermoplasmatota archaeon]|nr:30S ribosomal protein S3ae [Candidatus Thermoplasmatota archaeon]
MAGTQTSDSAARTAKDKWRAKQWYKINAPALFGGSQIADTLTDDPAKLTGRTVKVTLQDITGDFAKMHVLLIFQVDAVKGNEASTKFVGHEYTSDYVRRLMRRHRSRIDAVCTVKTKDGSEVILKPVAIAHSRIQNSQITALRNEMVKSLIEKATQMDFNALVKGIIEGTLTADVAKMCKTVYPVENIDMRKSEVVSQTDVPVEAKPAEETAAPAEANVENAPAEPAAQQ